MNTAEKSKYSFPNSHSNFLLPPPALKPKAKSLSWRLSRDLLTPGIAETAGMRYRKKTEKFSKGP